MAGSGAYTFGVALFAAIGTFLFVSIQGKHLHVHLVDSRTQGFDTGIATTSKYGAFRRRYPCSS